MENRKQLENKPVKPADEQITLPAELPRVSDAISFVENVLEEAACPRPVSVKMNIVTDEIFSNICKFAYPAGGGSAVLRVCVDSVRNQIRLIFSDSGAPFDPLNEEPPDTGLPAELRPVGGLGILMVRKMMDEVRYERRNGENILTLVKNF